ncbi:MAG TPA: M48 family metalloprotease [Verrucomicrobiae bacterium]|nr:M48 family metalloprotease [Verrucomicrobiae bacterium]
MEIAGENCKLCEQPVLSGADAAACDDCHSVFHQTCFENVQHICPKCGRINNPAEISDAPVEHPFLPLPEGEFQRLKPSGLYRFSLVVVSLAMILLPVIYVGMIGLLIYSVIAYLVRYAGLMNGLRYGLIGWLMVLLFYIGPMLIGTIMTFFLVKPFFAPRPPQEKPFSLNHADAPQLFALVGWICRSLEAPIPSRIDVDCKVNAGAGFRSGWRSLFGNDIIMVIGLPLVAGMDLAQFAGIIAHEYGHFSQGTAMRASYLINRINAWFFRLVYERDQWDLALEMASEQEHQSLFTALLLYMARFAVWLTRRLLWVLMATGAALSCFMSRQMEFDADRYETRLSGSEGFPATTRRLRQLNLGSDAAIKQIRDKWSKERKLFDQIPDFMVSRADEITAEAQEKLHASLSRRRTRLFDMHPSDDERVQHALAAREPGIFHSTMPAACLFADFSELSRRVTLNYYQSVFGRQIPAERLISTQQLKNSAEHDYEADRAQIHRYFLGIATELRPVLITENKSLLVRRPDDVLAELKDCRRAMEESFASAEPAFAEFIDSEAKLLQAEQAAQLLQAGFQFEPADFGLTDNETENAQAEACAALEAADARLTSFESAAKTRLTNSIQLLRMPQFASQIPDATQLQDEAKAMIWVLSRFEEIFVPVLELRKLCAMLDLLLIYRKNQPAADNVAPVLESLCMEIQERVNLLQQKTAQIRYPFHHATEQVMVSEYARNKNYHSDPVGLALREGQSHVEKLLDLYVRLLANLVLIGEEVERCVAPCCGAEENG